LEIETKKLQNEMNRVQTDAQKLVSEYTAEKQKLELRMQELADSSRQENERAKEEYNRQVAEIQKQLQQSSAQSASERQALVNQLEELRSQRSRSGGGFFGMIGRALDSVFGIH